MMPVIKKILYATDLSKNSSSLVFNHAVNMAKRHDAHIIVLHAVEPVHPVSYAGSSVAAMIRGAQKQDQEESREEIKKRIESFCTRAEQRLGPTCPSLVSKILVPVGNPVDAILQVVEEEGCDMIVLGAHKKGFLRQALLGDVARSVLERSRVPVLIVPLTSEEVYNNQDTI